jgi:hypothetical protein
MTDPLPALEGRSVTFSKYGGGSIVTCSGTVKSVSPQNVVLSYEGTDYSFRRAPGGKCGWGLGPAKAWRLGEAARRELCLPDSPRR